MLLDEHNAIALAARGDSKRQGQPEMQDPQWVYNVVNALAHSGDTSVRLKVHEGLLHDWGGEVYAGQELYKLCPVCRHTHEKTQVIIQEGRRPSLSYRERNHHD